jgi:hypothetical protein
MPKTGTRGTRWLAAALMGLIAGLGIARTVAGDCGPGAPLPTTKDTGEVRAQQVGGLDLTCFPAKLYALEGAWTFMLTGRDALRIDGARLELAGANYAPRRLTYTSPQSVLLDFVYPKVPPGGKADLVLLAGGKEAARVPIAVALTASVPPEKRQDDLVRVQMKQGVILYPLHGFPGDGITQRTVEDLGGDPAFRNLLQELQITALKKVLSKYAEDDSIHWDSRYLREEVYPGAQLRQYIFYLDPDRSEAAYREIRHAFDAVEDAYLNQDYRKSEGH